jgi:hypothetical protein
MDDMGTKNFQSSNSIENKNGKLFWKLIPVIVVVFIIGYIRELIFVHINFQRTQVYYHETDLDYNYTFPGILLFLKKLDYAQLTQLKWILTVLFYLIYFGITYLLISAIFKNKTYNLITIASHLVFFLIAGIFYLVGVFTGKGLEGYTLSREFMGILQSPLLLMILIPTFILSDRQKNLQKDINR